MDKDNREETGDVIGEGIPTDGIRPEPAAAVGLTGVIEAEYGAHNAVLIGAVLVVLLLMESSASASKK